ncbi:hypothetical protein SAMN06269250_2007 [Spirosoma fluviale]|uniref:Uncharacterized protein n=1 Tax=Spirosoma fluviale TaxID=1597977 RepID=A0A286FFQ4_9BACT|nr:hypothetical protein SAMN06269250_2007 [Spirosoma fluviale]
MKKRQTRPCNPVRGGLVIGQHIYLGVNHFGDELLRQLS